MISASRLPARLLVIVALLAAAFFISFNVRAEDLAPTAGCIYYVNVNVVGGTHSGSSWVNADPDLWGALYHNKVPAGCEIWVAKGVYKPSNRGQSFFLSKGVGIYGGFNGIELNRSDRNWTNNVTTLSGDVGVQGTDTDNCWNVVWGYYVTSTAVLDGFTITKGYARDLSVPNFIYYYGGGMELINSSPTLSNLEITNNQALYGGGMDLWNSSPVISNVEFWNNNTIISGTIGGNGGGIYIRKSSHPTLNKVGIFNNVANGTGNEAGGGGLYNDQTSGGLNLTDVVFNGNHAVQYGGGMFNYKVHFTMQRVRFLINYAYFGAGMDMEGEDGIHSLLVGVEFYNNVITPSGGKGAGLYLYQSSPTLVNVYFDQNGTASYGGGIGAYQSSPTLINTSFTSNTATSGGGAIYNSQSSHPVVQNSILWGDSVGEIYLAPNPPTSTITLAYSLVQGCNPSGAWNSTLCGLNDHNLVDADPKFKNPAGDDMHLTMGSPAINKGNNAFASLVLIDMDGQPRIQNGVVDLGPYELLFYPFYLPIIRR